MSEPAPLSWAAVFRVEVETGTLLISVGPFPFAASQFQFLSLEPEQITKVALRFFASRVTIVEEFVDRSGAEIFPSIMETNQLDVNLEAMNLSRFDLKTSRSRLRVHHFAGDDSQQTGERLTIQRVEH